jgi:hypothetical protein
MKTKHLVVFIALLALCLTLWGCATKAKQSSQIPVPAPPPAAIAETTLSASAPTVCTQNIDKLWQHVYHPDRLTVIQKCKTVTGTIALIRSEKDGDYHIQIKLDPGQSALLNQTNIDRQDGNLVVEPICEHKVTQASAKAACLNFSYPIDKLQKGTHVTVIGSYVHDTEGGHGWMEIHPIVSMVQN